MGRRNASSTHDIAESVDALKEDLSKFKQDVVELMHSVVNTGKAKSHEATDRVKDEVTHRLDQMRSGLNKLRHQGESGIQRAQETVERHPLMSVLCALGLGVLVSRFFWR